MAEQHSSKGIMWATIIVAIVLIAVIYPLTVKQSTSAADAAGSNDSADVRIQPVARFELAKAAPAVAAGPKDGATNGVPLVRTKSINGTASADGKSATIPYGGKPEGASKTSYAEFALAYSDRNGRDIAYFYVFQ